MSALRRARTSLTLGEAMKRDTAALARDHRPELRSGLKTALDPILSELLDRAEHAGWRKAAHRVMFLAARIYRRQGPPWRREFDRLRRYARNLSRNAPWGRLPIN